MLPHAKCMILSRKACLCTFLSQSMHEVTRSMYLKLATNLRTLSCALSSRCFPAASLKDVHALVQVTDTVKDDDDEKGWNLDDEAGFDEEDEEDVPTAKPEADSKAEDAVDLEEGGDEIDPLDAFMADNDAKVAPIKAEEQAAVQGNMHTCCTTAVHTCHVHANRVFYCCA